MKPDKPPRQESPGKECISFVIPTLREHAFEASLSCLLAYLDVIPQYRFEVLVVDDSDAETQRQMSELVSLHQGTLRDGNVVRVLCGPRRGKGAAVRLGAQSAEGAVVFVLDADLPVPLRYVKSFLETMRETDADLVVGERSRERYPDSPLRQFLSGGLRVIQKTFVFGNARFEDTQCGFKAFRAAGLRSLVERQLVSRGMYDLEYLYAATQRKLKVETVAVEHNPEVRPSRINLMSCLLFDPLDIMRFRIAGAFGRYRRDS